MEEDITNSNNEVNTVDGLFQSRLDLSELRTMVESIKFELGKVIIGQTEMIDLIIAAILTDGHVLIEGVPGVAKTLFSKLVARTIDSQFSRIQFTPDLMPSDVIGTSIFNQKSTEFEFRKGPIFSNIVLIDEINRAPAKTQAALFESMEERQVTVDGTEYKLDFPFLIVATQNPVEQEGTYRLPEAQLDRFMFKVEVGYPILSQEVAILQGTHQRKNKIDLNEVKPVLSAEKLKEYRESVQSIHFEEKLIQYVANIVNHTRDNSSLFLGASPRASIAILNGAMAFAALRGRDFVTPEDIMQVTIPVLVHRIVVSPEKEMEGVTAKQIIEEIIQSIEIPR